MRRALLLALSLTAWVSGCDDAEVSPLKTDSNVAYARPAMATRVLYGPQRTTLLTPFPSNRYTRPDTSAPTGLRQWVSAESTGDTLPARYPSISEQLNELDGFSTVGGVSVQFSGPIDLASIERSTDAFKRADAPLLLLDIDPSSPERGSLRGLSVRYFPTEPDEGDPDGDFTLVAQPSTPLRQKTRYLFVVTDAVRDEAGQPVGASDDMAALLDQGAPGSYEDEVRAALPLLEEKFGVSKDHVALATVFTTETVQDESTSMALALRASPAPVIESLVREPSSANDKRVRFTGTYTAPEWRRTEGDGHWQIANGAPVEQSTAKLGFTLVFSDKTVSGPRPVVIFGHGLGSDRSETWSVTNQLADLGVAVIGIDAPEHGSRASDDANEMISSAVRFFAIDLDNRSFDLEKGRDNLRQMASDQLQLVRALTGPMRQLDLLPVDAPDGVPDLDPDRIAYLGQSFGSIMGPAALAIAPEIQSAVLNVGGAGLLTLIQDSAPFKLLTVGLFEANAPSGEAPRLLSAAQALIDPGDSLNYARFSTIEPAPMVTGWSPKSVLLQEVINDLIVPNSTTALLARASGLTLVGPQLQPIDELQTASAPLSGNISGIATGGLYQYKIADGAKAEHGSLLWSQEGRRQYAAFFKAVFEGKPGVIYAPDAISDL